MLLQNILLAPIFLLAATTAAGSAGSHESLMISRTDSAAVPKPPFKYLFTATLELGKPLAPIAIPGGSRLVEPITNGSITGPALTATLTGGVAFPVFRKNMMIEEPDIIVYGQTNAKGGAFFATLQGVGSAVEQWTRVTVEIGPPYAYLNESYILGNILRGKGSTVTVNAFLVGNSAAADRA